MVDLSIIILNYNTKDFLQKLLQSILDSKLSGYKAEVLVVDNASEDGSTKMVKKKFKQFYLIENKVNLGYSKGNNVAINKAGGRYLLFLNSDMLLEANTLAKMLNFMDKNITCAAATCKIVLKNNKLDPACHRGFPTPWAALTYFSGLEKMFPKSKFFAQYHLGWKDLKMIHEIDAISGAFFMIRSSVLAKVGKFDEDFFIYGEDLDLCFRLRKMNYKICYYSGTKVVHFKKQSGRDILKSKKFNLNNKKIQEQTRQYFYDTMKIFYDKHYKHKYPWVIRQLVLAGIWVVSKIKK